MKVLFGKGEEKINAIFETYLSGMPSCVIDYLFDIIPDVCRYEEEEVKIKPELLVGINITQYLDAVPSIEVISFVKESVTDCRICSQMKSMIPICINEWKVFINFETETNIKNNQSAVTSEVNKLRDGHID